MTTTGEEEGDGATTTTARATTTTQPRTTTTTAPQRGTRENPFNLGEPLATDEGLGIIVNSVSFDAAAAIAAENQFNDPPPLGFRYALVNLTLTNNTAENVNSSFAVSVGMVGSANRQYDFGNASCRAVIPEPMSDGGDLFPGGTFTGNECLVVPEAEVLDGSLLVTVSVDFGDDVFVRTV